MIGTNDTGRGNTEEETFNGICRVVDKVHYKLPHASILLVGILPSDIYNWHVAAATYLDKKFKRDMAVNDRLARFYAKNPLLHFWISGMSFWTSTARYGRNYSVIRQLSSSMGKSRSSALQHGRAAPHGGSHSASLGTADEKAFQIGIKGGFPVPSLPRSPVWSAACRAEKPYCPECTSIRAHRKIYPSCPEKWRLLDSQGMIKDSLGPRKEKSQFPEPGVPVHSLGLF